MKKGKILRLIAGILVCILVSEQTQILSVTATETQVTENVDVSAGDCMDVSAGDCISVSAGDCTELPEETKEETEETQEAQEESPVEILCEVEELREEGVKHFRMSDGSFMAVSYGSPVHYKDEQGKWQDIDNSFTPGQGENGAAVYRNATPETSMEFATTLESGEIFKTSYKDVSVKMSLMDISEETELQGGQSGNKNQSRKDKEWSKGNKAGKETKQKEFNREASAKKNEKQNGQQNPKNGKNKYEEEIKPQKLQQSLRYEEVFPETDLEYTASGYNIKEQIIVKEPQTDYRYDFLMELEGLSAVLKEDGSIGLQTAKGEKVYEIPVPYMEDAAGEVSYEVYYSLKETKAGVVLSVEADAEWINSGEREFPVKIDPTLELEITKTNQELQATYVVDVSPDGVYSQHDVIFTGVVKHNGEYTCRSFLHINSLPQIPAGHEVVDAQLYLCAGDARYYGPDFTEYPIGLREVTGDKSPNQTYSEWINQMTWSNQPACGNYIDYAVFTRQSSQYLQWDISELAKKWYTENTQNTTVALVAMNEEEMAAGDNYAHTSFVVGGDENKPVLLVSYRSTMGLEPCYTYAEMSVGNAGTGYIADHTGQFKVVREVASYASVLNPFSLNLVYNSEYSAFERADYQPYVDMGLGMQMGAGWSLDAVQTLVPEKLGELEYMRYRDGDGTYHYFLKNKKDGLYYDEDGLGLKIKKIDDATYEMTDDADNLWQFKDGVLVMAMDNNRTKTGGELSQDGNRYNYVYTSDKKLSYIEQVNKGQEPVLVVSFDYNENDYLCRIVDAAGEVTTLTYSGTDLQKITRQNVDLAQYSYQNHRMTELRDIYRKYAVHLEYTDGKVSSYHETGNGVTGAKSRIEYTGADKTVYQGCGVNGVLGDGDDIYTNLLFDYAGRTVNIYSTDKKVTSDKELSTGILGADNAVYTASQTASDTESDISKTFRKNNRILRSSGMGVAAQQLIQDFGFEKGASATGWILEGVYSEGNGTAVAIKGDKVRTGRYSLKGFIPVNNSATSGVGARRETELLKKGVTYTFSAYVNTSQAVQSRGKGLYLEVLYAGETIARSSYVNDITSEKINDGWTRLSVSFTAQADAKHTVRIYNDRMEGIVYADDLQLETGEAPSNVNLLENGTMDKNTGGWNTNGYGSYANGAMMLQGNPQDRKVLFFQDVPLNLSGEESYILSGWCKAAAVPDNIPKEDYSENTIATLDDRQCGLRAIVIYTDGTTEYHYVPFNPDVTDWQFVSMAVVPREPSKTVELIGVYGIYLKNANTAYFDNLSLVRESASTMTYDEDGNLVSVTSTGLKEETDSYANGNLIRSMTEGRGLFNYEYDETYTHRLTGVTADWVGLHQSYSHDAMGNVTSTLLKSKDGGMSMQTTAAYSSDGNRMVKETDSSTYSTEYIYGDKRSETQGAPTIIKGANGNQVSRSYDTYGRLLSIGEYAGSGSTATKVAGVNYVYKDFRLYELIRNGGNNVTQTYRYGYDDFGNINGLWTGDRKLAAYTYSPGSGLLQASYNGNGDVVSYSYDRLGRIKSKEYGAGTVSYEYNGEGLLYRVSENRGGVISRWEHEYDQLGRLLYSERYSATGLSHRIANEYNANNQLTSQNIQMSGISYSQEYSYFDGDGNITGITIDVEGATRSDNTIGVHYDHLRRPSAVTNNLFAYSYEYQDAEGTGNLTTNRIKALYYSGEVGGISFKYGYDSVGNLTYYLAPEGNTTYTYDARNFLTKAFNGSTTYSYTYDGFGNILSASDGKVTHTYTYGNEDWKDLLTAYDGKQLQYDGAGNPLTYQNGTEWKLTWEDGRKLTTAKSSKGTVSYGYDLDGTRRNKTVDGVTHYYIWEGGRPLKEYVSGNTDVYKAGDTLYYFYDHNGRPFQLVYNGEPYYYILNLQGDVYRLVDSTGKTVAQYRYDPWGKVLEASGSMAEINPLRYRGYYYDRETGWYYLNSRYYDPSIGRFLNADAVGILTEGTGTPAAKNLFSYCDNNPVVRKDDEGTFWETAFDVVTLCASVADVAMHPEDPWAWGCLAMDTLDLIPFVTGLGEITKGVRVATKADEVADAAADVVKTVKKGGSKTVDINNPVLDNIRTGSALKGDSLHAFNNIIDNYAGDATKFSLTGGDGVERTLYQLEGSLNGKQGIFEWIVDPDPTKGVTHRRFIEGVGITGKPNARP